MTAKRFFFDTEEPCHGKLVNISFYSAPIPVKTTSDITRGFNSAKKSSTVAAGREMAIVAAFDIR